jgi:rubrerythrin
MQVLRDVIAEASRLESLAMGIYTRLAATFREDAALHRFWMSMARHEAGHVGALALLHSLLELADEGLRFEVDDRVAREAAVVIEGLHAECQKPVEVKRAFAIALELESLELEDLVLDLIHVLSDPAARSQAEQMLLHDLSDLSLMIEKYCHDDELLARADALVESRVGQGSGGHVRRC